MQIPGKALHGYKPFPQRTHSTCAGLNVRRAEGKMCQWPIDMRCLLPSYSVSFRGGTILLEAEQPNCKVLLIEAPPSTSSSVITRV